MCSPYFFRSAPESALEGALPGEHSREHSESTPISESTAESTPESTPESTFGGFPVLGSLAGQQTLNSTVCFSLPPSPKSLGQRSGRTKVPRIFRIVVPNFLPNFAPNFPRIFQGVFVLCFQGNGDQEKFTKNPRPFSMQNSQATTKKLFTKCFWRAGKLKIARYVLGPPPPPRSFPSRGAQGTF